MTTGGPAGPEVLTQLEREVGLSFRGPRRDRMVKAVEERRRAERLSDPAFAQVVAGGGTAFDRLIGDLTVGETSFFRDRLQCELLREVIFPELARQPGGCSIWSAGCSSGEEAYTLAAMAQEAQLGGSCVVVGSDISAQALERARRAVYGMWSLRSVTPAERASCFRPTKEGVQVLDRLRRQTRFVQGNLLDGAPAPGRFDLVLCRNVLIYLTPEAVRRVAAVLTQALTPEGWLVTAAGDPPLEAADLQSVRTAYGRAYRRRSADVAATPTGARRHPPPPRTRPAAAPRSRMPEREAVPPPTAPDQPLPGTPSVAAVADRIRRLGDSGQLAQACAEAAQAVSQHPLVVELHYLAAVVLGEAGRLDDAAAEAAAAVYLGPELAAAHLLLGQLEHARGDVHRARRSFRNGARLLAASPEQPVALAGDLPAAHLAHVAATYLAASSEAAP